MGPKICSPRFQLRNSSRDRLFWRKSRQLRECWLAGWLLTIELGWRTVIYSRTKRHGSPNATAPVRGWSRPRNAGQLLNRSLAAARDFSFAGHGLRHYKGHPSSHFLSPVVGLRVLRKGATAETVYLGLRSILDSSFSAEPSSRQTIPAAMPPTSISIA